MKWIKRKRQSRRGVLSLEWILLITVLVVGIIGGLGAVRNAMISELQDLAEAIDNINIKTEAECVAEGFADCEAAAEAP